MIGIWQGKRLINAEKLLDELAVTEAVLKTEVEQQYEECVSLVFDEVRQIIANFEKDVNI